MTAANDLRRHLPALWRDRHVAPIVRVKLRAAIKLIRKAES